MPSSVKLPIRVIASNITPATFYLYDDEDRTLGALYGEDAARTIVAVMNATQRSDCKRCGGVCGNGLATCEPRDYVAELRAKAEPTSNHYRGCICAECVKRREVRQTVKAPIYIVQELNGLEVSRHASLDDAWASMGPGKRIVTR